MQGTMMNWCFSWVIGRSRLVEVLGRMMGAIGMGSWCSRVAIDRGCRSCVRMMVGAICWWGRRAIMMTMISRRCYCCTMMILIGRSIVK